LYQGRFKTFPIERDQHLRAVLRYVERNALRANLCTRAEDWKYGSLWRRTSGNAESRELLSEWPISQPQTWVAMVNRAQSEAEEKAIRKCLKTTARLMIGIEQSNFELVQENDSFFFERDFFMIL